MTSSPPENRRVRILAFWGAAHYDFYFQPSYVDNPHFEVEVVSGDRSRDKSPTAASWKRLFELRRRLKAGEFDLVLSSPVQNTAWPPNKRLATRLAQGARYLLYKNRMLDAYWVPWMLSGRVGQRVPLAVIDFLDTSFVLPKDYALLRASTLYFKINLYFWPERSLLPLESFLGRPCIAPFGHKLRPLTVGVLREQLPPEVRPMRDRDIDLCLTGNIRPLKSAQDRDPFVNFSFNPIRQDIYERCLKLKGRYNVFCADGNVSAAEYTELLQRSKMVVCTESFGCETGRLQDAAGAGAVPLVNWPYAQHYHQYEPDVHALYFSLFGDDFERVVAQALADPEKLDRISRQARTHTWNEKDRRDIADHVVAETLRAHAADAETEAAMRC